MKQDEAITSPDKDKWEAAVKVEHGKLVEEKVLKVQQNELSRGTKVLSSTWAIKKKQDGRYQARMNTRGYE
jgi:hypothetical protein